MAKNCGFQAPSKFNLYPNYNDGVISLNENEYSFKKILSSINQNVPNIACKEKAYCLLYFSKASSETVTYWNENAALVMTRLCMCNYFYFFTCNNCELTLMISYLIYSHEFHLVIQETENVTHQIWLNCMILSYVNC